MDSVFYGFSVFLFAAVILLVEGGYLWWSSTHGGGAKRIARRLRHMSGGVDASGEKVSILKQRPYADNEALDAFLHRLPPCHAIERLLLQAGMRWSVAQFLGTSIGGMVAALLFLMMMPMPGMLRLGIAMLFLLLPMLLARRARTQRLIRIEAQLPEAADFLARAMRAGHSFNNVMQMVGTELPEPLSGEFRAAHEEINYGVPMNEALYNLADRVPLTDLRYLVIAVVIQRESGGNLAEILGNISHIIRERLKLLGKVRVLSAEGRMSAWVLGLMPFCVIALMTALNPEYVATLWTDPLGVQMLCYGFVMMVIGVLWIRRLIHIRV